MPSANREICSDSFNHPCEADLILKAKEGDATAFDRLVEACLPTIRSTAWSFARSRDLFEELVHEGKVALWERVVLHFDADRSDNFRGYLSRCLRSAMFDYINSLRHRSINRDIKTVLGRLSERNRIFRNENGRSMTDEERADFLSQNCDRPYSAAEVRDILEFSLPNRLTSPMTDLLPNPTDPPEQEAAHREEISLIREKALAATRHLGKRERDIYRRHMGLERNRQEWTLEAIGQRYDISKERVRQLVSRSHQRVSALLSVDPALKEISDNLA